MNRLLFFTGLIFILNFYGSNFSYAQTSYYVKGVIKDVDENSFLSNANVMLLHAQDSIIYESVRTDATGNFHINNPQYGSYILVVSYLNYVDFIDTFSIDASIKNKDFGIITMITREDLLTEVVVKSQVAAIRIKGDTTEFVADSFNVLPNASVEDLLKKLPGIQIDREGNITAQGERVKRVLVDGEEFFGDDPTLVTKNFRADMVDKVQLYDKKSDQAVFTGIDDGIRDKTINLKIKEDKKSGFFGKLEGGYGTSNFYQNQAIINYFKGNSKISVYGTYANTGKNGLARDDLQRFYISRDYSDDLGPLTTNWNGRYSGEGIPRIISGGLHFDTKWNENKQKINTDFQSGNGRLTGNRTSKTVTNIDANNAQTENTVSDFDRLIIRNKLDAAYTFDIDTTLSVSARISGTLSNWHNKENFLSSIKNKDSININSDERHTDFSSNSKIFGSNFILQKKLKKQGRTLSFDLKQYFKNVEEEGNLYSEINFYQLNNTQIFDQYKKNTSGSNTYSGEINYTEPLSEFSRLGIVYQYNYNNSKSDRRTFNKNNNYYNLLDSLYSNDFRYIQSGNLGGLSYIYGKNKENINIGFKANFLDIQQENTIKNTLLNRRFVDIIANATYNKSKGQKRFYTGYWGNTVQPEIRQLQPVMLTEDSLNIFIGNELLKPSFRHSLFMNYGKFSSIFNEYIVVFGSVDATTNPIITNLSIEPETGVKTYTYFNTSKSNYNYNLGMNYGGKLKKIDAEITTGISLDAYSNFTSVNNQLTNTKNYTIAPNLRLNKVKKDVYDITFYMEGGYNIYKTDIGNVPDNNSFYFTIRPEAEILLPLKMKLLTDADYHWRQRTQAFNQSFSRFLWNAQLEKRFLKNETLLLRLSANDILNQNIGFTRNVTNNVYNESRYTTIPRYFMLSLIFDFNKMGGMVKKEEK